MLLLLLLLLVLLFEEEGTLLFNFVWSGLLIDALLVDEISDIGSTVSADLVAIVSIIGVGIGWTTTISALISWAFISFIVGVVVVLETGVAVDDEGVDLLGKDFVLLLLPDLRNDNKTGVGEGLRLLRLTPILAEESKDFSWNVAVVDLLVSVWSSDFDLLRERLRLEWLERFGEVDDCRRLRWRLLRLLLRLLGDLNYYLNKSLF